MRHDLLLVRYHCRERNIAHGKRAEILESRHLGPPRPTPVLEYNVAPVSHTIFVVAVLLRLHTEVKPVVNVSHVSKVPIVVEIRLGIVSILVSAVSKQI